MSQIGIRRNTSGTCECFDRLLMFFSLAKLPYLSSLCRKWLLNVKTIWYMVRVSAESGSTSCFAILYPKSLTRDLSPGRSSMFATVLFCSDSFSIGSKLAGDKTADAGAFLIACQRTHPSRGRLV